MLPESITTLLNRLRNRERLLTFSWSAARWFAVLAAALVTFCGIDYFVDLYRETPFWLRFGMAMVTFLLAPMALAVPILSAALRSLPDTEVALWVEKAKPFFGHRLISAVQFNSAGAKTEGMSEELIAAVTRQAAQMAREAEPSQVRDGRRGAWAAWLAGPVLAGLLLIVGLNPTLVGVLFGRLVLGVNEPIPRSIDLIGTQHEVWPAGEEGALTVVVLGRIPSPEITGEVRVEREDGTVSYHTLTLSERHPTKADRALYTAHVPAGDVPFTCTARLADGRTHVPGRIEYSPRPVVQSVEAWVQLPESVGLRPGRHRYEEPQKGGDIVHRLPGSLARVRMTTQKPIAKAIVHIQGQAPRTAMLALDDDQSPEGIFSLQPGDTGYEIEVRDEHNFANADRPRRTISPGSLEPPDVALLPESFARSNDTGPREDYEAEGVPVAVDAPFRLEYTCAHRYGLSHAQLRYRVIPHGAAKEESGAIDLAKFRPLPLGPPRGQRAKATAQALREFSTKPSAPDALPDTEGGGTYDFELTGIPDGQGGRLKVKEGDRVQYFVEVFSKADPDGTPGRSVIREKEVVSKEAYADWFIQKINLTERTRELEERQRGAAPPGGGS